MFLTLLILSHTQSVLLLQPEHLQNHQEKKVLGQASGTGNKYASLFSKARFRGSGHEVDNDDNPKRNRIDSNKKNLDHPDKQGPFSRGDPDEEDDNGNDRDGNDEDNDSKPPSIEGISLLLGNNTQWSPTETASKKLTMVLYPDVQHLSFYNSVFST